MPSIPLPDFDDLLALAQGIGRKRTQLTLAKARLDEKLALITQRVTNDERFWVAGKPPSNAHIKDTYHVLGYNPESRQELAGLRQEIAELEGQVKTDELTFDVYKNMIEVWRTQSANERSAFIE